MNAPDPDSDLPNEEVDETNPAPESSEPIEDAVPEMNAFLPVVLLGLSIGIILVSMVSSANTQQTALNQAIEKNQPLLQQGAQLQNATMKLISDLLEVAKDDNDAKQILLRANIRRQDGQPLISAGTPQASGSGSAK